MKQLISISLLLSILLPMGMKVCIITHYGLNIKEITEKYCINKDKPMLHCNGKCHLAKQLKAANTEKNTNNAMSILSWLDPIQLLYQQKKQAFQPFYTKKQTSSLFFYLVYLHKGYATVPYTPPNSSYSHSV